MNTKQQEYELKLDSLFMELKNRIIKNSNKEFSDLKTTDAITDFLYDRLNGNLIDMKKHGLNLVAMVCNEIIEKC